MTRGLSYRLRSLTTQRIMWVLTQIMKPEIAEQYRAELQKRLDLARKARVQSA